MRYRVVCLVLLFHALMPAIPSQATDLPLVRENYGSAVRAINRGQWTEYQQLRPGLEDYPLAIYLDFFELSRRTPQVRPGDANLFLQRSQGSPLTNRFLAGYLSQAGRDGRWRDFLAVTPTEPNSIELKCYYFRARLEEGDPLVAWEGAERLWVHGESRPKACDPLFDAWQKTGQLSDEIVWARLLKAFEARQRPLMNFVAGRGSGSLRPWSERLLEVYASPDRLRSLVPAVDDPRAADIVAYGTAYFARYKPGAALQQWLQYSGEMSFDESQLALAEGALASRTLLAKATENLPWLEQALGRLNDDNLVEIRLRWALQERDWEALAANLQKLSLSARADPGWRYWQAAVHERAGQQDLADALWRDLAQERDYYGFLAAERMGLPPAFNHQVTVLDPERAAPLRQLPAVRRIEELYYHDEENLAHSEWYQVLQNTSAQEQQELARLAADLGWHRMAIDAANKAEAWDALDLRFPTPYQETFSRHASQRQVPVTELMAIARRESAFYAGARSPVGARGLMQVMPATGKQVAAQLKASHSDQALYDVEHNVLLGSAYYRQLLDRYSGNRVLAMAAYNAGPHRVDRWRNRPGETVPVDVWIETIPFRETRNYVKAVLAYNLVFKYLLGQEGTLLTEQERRLTY